ncbi:NAD(P)/FAD-dependent oxidoreductase [Roseospira goensis]|uniref:4-methylaminobutanoate oxidase (Formaldehyde-forming) n=1 Tax=Roseospira goensis TaxID=391922 RepID=A0A7W6WJQ5_9PROT|nr:FAD-dependent oxidoreductase [Roseospira goensis]MBB4284743.1 4-methylaminobutanoate oxidase (formaldehyde-forming) [Roseospira goensis]
MSGAVVPSTADVVVIGGGIWGSATAEALCRYHGADVVVLERESLSAATTSRGAALMPRARSTATLRAMVCETYAAIESLEAQLGEDLQLHRVGALHIATSEATRATQDAQVTAARAEGDRVEHPDSDTVAAMVPWLRPDADRAYAFFPDDGFIDPYKLGMAYAQAARRHGATLCQGVEVTGILRAGRRVVGVETTAGRIACATVVCAAGPWSALVGLWSGARLPLAPVRSHYWITAPNETLFPRDQVMVFAPDGRFYARPEVGGLLYGFRDRVCVAADPRDYPPDPSGFAFGHDDAGWESLNDALKGFRSFWDGLGDVPVAHYIAAASAYTPDGQFVIGPWPEIEGFVAVTGCSGAGIATSGGVGRAAAALAVGAEPPWDLSAFRPDRFGAVDPLDRAFLDRCAAARANKRSG